MYLGKIKIGNIFLILVVLYFLGYTHFLGGPYGLAKFFFILILVGIVIFWLSIFSLVGFVRKIFRDKRGKFSEEVIEENNETIKVDAKIIE